MHKTLNCQTSLETQSCWLHVVNVHSFNIDLVLNLLEAPTCSPFPPNFQSLDALSVEWNIKRRSGLSASQSVSVPTDKSRGKEAWRRTRDEEAECHQRAAGTQGGVTHFDSSRVRMLQRAVGNIARSFPNSEYFYASETHPSPPL